MKSMGIQGVIRGKPHRTTIPDKKAPCPLDKGIRRLRPIEICGFGPAAERRFFF